MKILLIDDEIDFIKALERRLQKRGFDVRVAGSGAQGLEILGDTIMDVVVLDVKMPEMGGLEVLSQIRQNYPQTQVILLTGHASTADGVAGIKSGAFDYLTKPVEFEHLVSKIDQAYQKVIWDKERLQQAQYKKMIEQQMIAAEHLASLGTLAAGVAHEINNPLAIINESAGFLNFLFDKPEFAELHRKSDIKKALNKIETAVERAKRITHQLLGVVRKNENIAMYIELGDIVSETISLVEKQAKLKDVNIVCRIDPLESEVWVDPYQLRQILINILNNAIYAVDKGGQIVIAATSDPENNSRMVDLSVQDNGPGVPKENIGKIFEPFFTTKPPGQGTGLGLFVTRSIVNKLGGTIGIESKMGSGTTVLISLPKNPVREGRANKCEK